MFEKACVEKECLYVFTDTHEKYTEAMWSAEMRMDISRIKLYRANMEYIFTAKSNNSNRC